MTIESPCIKICVMDAASGLCRGCGRSLAEIGDWASLSAAARAAIMERLPGRMRAAGLPPATERPATP
ncbi:MAG: DUF1289 domain-containing protein [Xanthobacteraceae bacterium]|nr:DUF1289 domain-containing protein [Xanthobacteraceae bacterium]